MEFSGARRGVLSLPIVPSNEILFARACLPLLPVQIFQYQRLSRGMEPPRESMDIMSAFPPSKPVSRMHRWITRVVTAILALFSCGDASEPLWGQRLQPLPTRLPAPGLEGPTDWLNSDKPLQLPELRGKFVVLDFWTYCCVNCLHVLPELKKLEEAHPNHVVVIGVHSGKFDAERETENIRKAVLRHDIRHPVVNDDQQILWNRYRVNAWPSLRIIDPHGFLVAAHSGEFHFEALDDFIRRATPVYMRQGVINPAPLEVSLEQNRAPKTALSFPGKVLADAGSDRVFIADSAHHRIVVTTLEGELLDVIGDGTPGRQDGKFQTARFRHPQGMAFDGESLYVADTENHSIRRVNFAQKTVTTVAGTGKQAGLYSARGRPSGPLQVDLASPWDLYLDSDDLYIAMAGTHQIWKFELGEKRIAPHAGTGIEDVVDGPLTPSARSRSAASFAQPSGLTSNGRWLFVADAEGSSIRAVPIDPRQKVSTVVGTADLTDNRLFTFGDQDGSLDQAQLQHPLGVAWWNNGLLVADTYNHKIKFIRPGNQGSVTTLAGDGTAGRASRPAQFFEPSGLSVAGQQLFIADTNNHTIRVMDLEPPYRVRMFPIRGLSPPSRDVDRAESPADVPKPANASKPSGSRRSRTIPRGD
jgi:thiol-disulfide isomerase/thioredoxin